MILRIDSSTGLHCASLMMGPFSFIGSFAANGFRFGSSIDSLGTGFESLRASFATLPEPSMACPSRSVKGLLHGSPSSSRIAGVPLDREGVLAEK
jgi:hypothetical protein